MANKDTPCGLKPYGKIKQVKIAEAGSTVYPGDAVILAADGQVDSVSSATDIYGVALSYATAGQDVVLSVDPDQEYIIQGDSDGSTDVASQADIGQVCDLLFTAGDSTYKMSRQELNVSDLNTSGGQMLVLGLAPGVDNAFGEHAKIIVKINMHQAFGNTDFAGI